MAKGIPELPKHWVKGYTFNGPRILHLKNTKTNMTACGIYKATVPSIGPSDGYLLSYASYELYTHCEACFEALEQPVPRGYVGTGYHCAIGNCSAGASRAIAGRMFCSRHDASDLAKVVAQHG